MIDLDELERVAREATPGPWVAMERPAPSFDDHGYRAICRVNSARAREVFTRSAPWTEQGWKFGTDEDAAFIARANPTAILELVAELREARAVVDACIDEDNEGEQAYALAKAYRAKWGE